MDISGNAFTDNLNGSSLIASTNLKLGLVLVALSVLGVYNSSLFRKHDEPDYNDRFDKFTLTSVTSVNGDISFIWRLIFDYKKNRLRVDSLEIPGANADSAEAYNARLQVAKEFFLNPTMKTFSGSVDLLSENNIQGPATLIFDNSDVYGIYTKDGETPVCKQYGHDDLLPHLSPFAGATDKGHLYVQGSLTHHWSNLNFPTHDGSESSQKTDLWVDEFTGLPLVMQAVGKVIKNEGKKYDAEVLHQVLAYVPEIDVRLLQVTTSMKQDVCVKIGGDIGLEWLMLLEEIPMLKNLWDVVDLQ
ncbi:hypothetical protein HK099_005973 [Clydaea vesicula]|uniref:Uncharacterized protein n=1 Tax=Clydaea vesicula TaxID=447962 RepID=A0AAD5U303_9FUNG|nr:hypothetical protein HK099_005973 [Clydaea vesicula]